MAQSLVTLGVGGVRRAIVAQPAAAALVPVAPLPTVALVPVAPSSRCRPAAGVTQRERAEREGGRSRRTEWEGGQSG